MIINELYKIAYKNKIPVKATFELTYDCNLHCKHCYVVRRKGKKLTLEEWFKLIEKLRKLGTLSVTLTGGEPLLYTDFFEIARKLREEKMAIYVITNGTLIDKKIVEKLKEIHPVEIGISIYGFKEKTHEKITGVKGSHRRTMEAIKLLKENDFNITLKIIITKYNIDEIENLILFAKDLKINYQVDALITPKDNGDNSPLQYRASQKAIIKLAQQNEEILRRCSNKFEDNENLLCGAGITTLTITPFGEIKPCIQMPLICGNIRDTEIEEIWENSKELNMLRNIRAEDLKDCLKCELRPYCNRCPGLALIESGDLRGKALSSCWMAEISKKLQS